MAGLDISGMAIEPEEMDVQVYDSSILKDAEFVAGVWPDIKGGYRVTRLVYEGNPIYVSFDCSITCDILNKTSMKKGKEFYKVQMYLREGDTRNVRFIGLSERDFVFEADSDAEIDFECTPTKLKGNFECTIIVNITKYNHGCKIIMKELIIRRKMLLSDNIKLTIRDLPEEDSIEDIITPSIQYLMVEPIEVFDKPIVEPTLEKPQEVPKTSNYFYYLLILVMLLFYLIYKISVLTNEIKYVNKIISDMGIVSTVPR